MSEESMLASKLRKEFYRQFGLSLGDLIQTNNVIGSFRGISTYNDPSQITVELQTIVQEKGTQTTDIKTLPENMPYGHKEIPIRYDLQQSYEFPQDL
mgnify:CR=1 FL=1